MNANPYRVKKTSKKRMPKNQQNFQRNRRNTSYRNRNSPICKRYRRKKFYKHRQNIYRYKKLHNNNYIKTSYNSARAKLFKTSKTLITLGLVFLVGGSIAMIFSKHAKVFFVSDSEKSDFKTDFNKIKASESPDYINLSEIIFSVGLASICVGGILLVSGIGIRISAKFYLGKKQHERENMISSSSPIDNECVQEAGIYPSLAECRVEQPLSPPNFYSPHSTRVCISSSHPPATIAYPQHSQTFGTYDYQHLIQPSAPPEEHLHNSTRVRQIPSSHQFNSRNVNRF